jgi:aspartyl-tRNA(Asn)/glutamyl-tRNA(Gln) amidotransferase subunit C
VQPSPEEGAERRPRAAIDPRTPEGVAHIARLSRLALSKDELQGMASHLGKILDAVSALDRLDTTGVPAGLHDGAAAGLRPDVIAPSLTVEDALRPAPRSSAGGFEVPPVLAE